MSNAVLFETPNYNVIEVFDSPVMGDDGKTSTRNGYHIVNTKNDFIEASTTCLPNAIYMATHFNDMLVGLLTPAEVPSDPTEADILPIH